MNKSILHTLKDILAELLELPDADALPDTLSMGDRPDWDSLLHMGLLLRVKERFGFLPKPAEILHTVSLPLLARLVQDKTTGQDTEASAMRSGWFGLLEELFEDAPPPADACFYIHSRAASLLACGLGDLRQALESLRGPDQRRTLVFPAFPFSSKTYLDYISRRPPFRVADTTALTGLLPELVRSELTGVHRSAHPLLSEMAVGPRAEGIVADAHLHKHPFHPGSTYQRLLDEDAHMLGLGVDINTNAFIHWVDDQFKNDYPFKVFLPEPLKFEIEHLDGRRERRAYLAYSPQMVRRIRPRNLRHHFADSPEILREVRRGDASFFRLRLRPFLQRCAELAEQSLSRSELPPWFAPEPSTGTQSIGAGGPA